MTKRVRPTPSTTATRLVAHVRFDGGSDLRARHGVRTIFMCCQDRKQVENGWLRGSSVWCAGLVSFMRGRATSLPPRKNGREQESHTASNLPPATQRTGSDRDMSHTVKS